MKEKKIRESARLADRSSNDFTKGFPRETGARAGQRQLRRLSPIRNPSGQTVDGVTFVTGSYIYIYI
jgi:hypothetical protein